MPKVVAAFVGYAPNFEHPFEVAKNHGTALQALYADKECYGFRTTNIPKYYAKRKAHGFSRGMIETLANQENFL